MNDNALQFGKIDITFSVIYLENLFAKFFFDKKRRTSPVLYTKLEGDTWRTHWLTGWLNKLWGSQLPDFYNLLTLNENAESMIYILIQNFVLSWS